MTQAGDRFLEETIGHMRVAVIGDVMTDRYIFGQVSRISPEAPVPVNLVQSQKAVLGGAGNTAANLASLGCQVYMSGMRADDENGHILSRLFKESGIDDSGILLSRRCGTITKMRILGARQQMMRLDFETFTPLTKEEEDTVLAWLERHCQNGLDSIILSDYGKGFITSRLAQQVIRIAKEWQLPVLVDPKGSDWSKYDGAYGITPNLKELSECVGEEVPNEDAAVEKASKSVRNRFHLAHLFVTRSEKGITAVGAAGALHCPAAAQDVFDVSGAGDTVMAVTAAASAAGMDMRTLLLLANTAAGIAVSRVGTYPVKRAELLAAWRERNREAFPGKALLSWEEAAEKIKVWKEKGETVVFTNGCFDLLHRGHVTYLQQAASLGDHLVIGLNSDVSVRLLKGESRPVVREKDRAFLLASLRCVDGVVLFSEETPEKLLSLLKPDILVKGGDYAPKNVAGRQYAGAVKILPFIEGYSTSAIIQKIEEEER